MAGKRVKVKPGKAQSKMGFIVGLIFVGIGVFTAVFGSATSIRKYLKERKFVELED